MTFVAQGLRSLLLAATLAVLFAVPGAVAQGAGHPGQPEVDQPSGADFTAEDEALDVAHHVADGFYLDFSPIPKIELPRIFLVRKADGTIGMDAFWSSTAAVNSGRYDVTFDDHGSTADHVAENSAEDRQTPDGVAQSSLPAVAGAVLPESGHMSVLDGTLVRREGRVILDLSITRHLVFVWIVSILMIVTFLWLSRRYAKGVGRVSAPEGKVHNALEALVVYVRDEIAEPNLGRHTERYMPFLLTLWFFILFSNLIGLFPMSVTSTANITVTGVLAVFTFVVTQASGKKDYWIHILWPPGIPLYVKPILVPIEILGLFIKPFVLAVRLFANMTAGHMVLLSLLGLGFTLKASYGASGGYIGAGAGVMFALFIYLIELLVAFLQAYIFVMLSALYIGMALEEHEHADDEHEPTHDGLALGVFHEPHAIAETTNGVEAREPVLVG